MYNILTINMEENNTTQPEVVQEQKITNEESFIRKNKHKILFFLVLILSFMIIYLVYSNGQNVYKVGV